MNLREKNLLFTFLVSLICFLILPSLFPSFNLYYLIPFIIISFYQKPLLTCLWYALFCGLIIDIFSGSSRLGFTAMNYTLSVFLLYPQKKHFFSDSITTLPIMTFLFSLLSTVFQFMILYSLNKQPLVNIKWIASDLLLMSFFDAAFAFTLFVIPGLLIGKRSMKGSDYFTE